jgi:catechol 2,3-dioxygenase-like lactoylglutathione lyase family enzyme
MALPTIVGVDHFGFSVPDIEQAHDFLVRILGCLYVYSLPGFRDAEGSWMRDHFNVDERAVVKEARLYRLGTGSNLEVFEYSFPLGRQEPPPSSDVGGHHIGLYVDDIDAAVAYLRAEGVTVLGEPTASSNASLGQRWVYFLSPWGMQFELVSFPSGKAYERDAKVKLWHPGHPAD